MIRRRSPVARARQALNRTRLDVPRVPVAVRDCVVLQTFAIGGKPGAEISHYSITFAPAAPGQFRPFYVVTQSAVLYALACEAEGRRECRCDVTYTPQQRADGVWLNHLTVLECYREG